MFKVNLIRIISKIYGLFNKNSNGTRIFIYHSVENTFKIDKNGLNNIEFDLFKQHVNVYKKYNVVDLFPTTINNNKFQIVITFDDGYADNLLLAAPILVSNKIPFTVFVTTDFVNKRKEHYLTPEQLIELSKMHGVTIGSHTKTHPYLTKCSEEQVYFELLESKKYLEDLIKKPVHTLSYPFGDVNKKVRQIAERVGYKVGCCSNFSSNLEERDRLLLNRCFILNYDTINDLNEKINGNWDWFKFRYTDPIKK